MTRSDSYWRETFAPSATVVKKVLTDKVAADL